VSAKRIFIGVGEDFLGHLETIDFGEMSIYIFGGNLEGQWLWEKGKMGGRSDLGW
jgi:hypothetical protein